MRTTRDAILVEHVLARLAASCPFPAVVLWEPDYHRLSVRAAGVLLAALEPHTYGTDELGVATLLGVRAAQGYHDLEPLPHDHQLGQD